MNSDVIRIIYGLLPDCRGAALVCAEWYNAYVGGPDHAYWAGGRSLARLLPKMYGSVWRGSIYTLADAGNCAVIHSMSGHYSRAHWERIGVCAAEHGHVGLVLSAIAMGGKNVDTTKIWAAGARDSSIAVWAEWHRRTGDEIPIFWLENCCVETLRWYFDKFVRRPHWREYYAYRLCAYPCASDVRVLQYLHSVRPNILTHNICLCSTIFDAGATDALKYLVENGGDIELYEEKDAVFRHRLSTRPLAFTKYVATLFYGGDPYEHMFKHDERGAAAAVLGGDSVADIAAVLDRLPQYRIKVIEVAASLHMFEAIHALITREEFAAKFPCVLYPDDTYIAKYAEALRGDIISSTGGRAYQLVTAPIEVIDKLTDIFHPTSVMQWQIFERAACYGSLDEIVAFFQRHNYKITEKMMDILADRGRFDLVIGAATQTSRESDTINE